MMFLVAAVIKVAMMPVLTHNHSCLGIKFITLHIFADRLSAMVFLAS